MQKFCVFCGATPRGKNKEHIIPKWLIELTGNPNRQAFFGFDVRSDTPRLRKYAFDAFSFPACSECNAKFSQLEGAAKRVIVSMLEEKAINDLDVSCLLNWLDKVRVGLWLGFLMLCENQPEITPKFHINSRIAAADRLVFVYRLATERTGVNFIGPESPSFLYVPSSFALLINNFCFFNVSHFNLCDRRLGFPYAREAFYRGMDMNIEADFVEGLGRCFHPVLRNQSLPDCTRFYQPIFSKFKDAHGLESLFRADYVRDNSLDWDKGIGRVFYEVNGRPLLFPRHESHDWWPHVAYSIVDFLPAINQQVYDFQIEVVSNAASLRKMSKTERTTIRQHLQFYRNVNNLMIRFVREQVANIVSH